MTTPSIPTRLITSLAFIAIVSVVFLINAQFSFHMDEAITYALGSNVQTVDTTKQQRNSRQSKPSSSHLMIPIEDINSTEYIAFDNACIYPDDGRLAWTLLVKDTRAITTNDVDPPTEERDHDQVINVSVFSDVYNNHSFRVVHDHNFSMTSFRLHRREGCHLLIGPHTPDNNFHLLNDLLLPVYRAFIKTRISGIVFFQGCDKCWEKRLPAMSLVFNMMNLSVTYPLERVVSIDTPICVDRLIIRDYAEFPYLSREGRFSSYWSQEIFKGFRDSSHAYFQSLLSSHDSKVQIGTPTTPTSIPEEEANDDSESETSQNASKPVLTWVPRSSSAECKYRCITNGHELVDELSKYFLVFLLDFNANFTTEHAVVLMRDTDVLVGLHGAGLGYTAYLPDRAMVIELKSALNSEKKLFINMASSMDIPYYGVNLGCLSESTNYVYTLPSDIIQSLALEIADAYHQEKIIFSRGLEQSTGQCLFPQEINPCGHLSPTNVSRCYLEQPTRDAPWTQCVHFQLCD